MMMEENFNRVSGAVGLIRSFARIFWDSSGVLEYNIRIRIAPYLQSVFLRHHVIINHFR